MKRNVCKVTLLLILSFAAHIAEGQDTIQWQNNYKLTWSDFKGKPNSDSKHRAVTSSGISYSYSFSDTGTYFKTHAFFVTKRSWTKSFKDTNTLKHEQGHFDITEMYARKLLAAFQKLNQDKIATRPAIAQVVEKLIAQKNEFQKEYDFETSFGTNVSVQKKWEQLILSHLAE